MKTESSNLPIVVVISNKKRLFQKVILPLFAEKVTFDYKQVANDKSLEKMLSR
jgi:hypothetical protein